jgi:hypothetical protein
MVYKIFIVSAIFLFINCKSEKIGLREVVQYENDKKVVRYYNPDNTLNKILVYEYDTILVKYLYTRNGENGIRKRTDSIPVFMEDSCYNCNHNFVYTDENKHLTSFNLGFDFYSFKSPDGEILNEFKLINSDTNRVRNIFNLGDTTIITDYIIKWVKPNNRDTLSRIPILYKE